VAIHAERKAENRKISAKRQHGGEITDINEIRKSDRNRQK